MVGWFAHCFISIYQDEDTSIMKSLQECLHSVNEDTYIEKLPQCLHASYEDTFTTKIPPKLSLSITAHSLSYQTAHLPLPALLILNKMYRKSWKTNTNP
jgi:hypothetical protein